MNLESLFNRTSYDGKGIHRLLIEIYQAMESIEPVSEDEIRKIWLEIPRGSLEDYGDLEEFIEEGIVNNQDEFERLWKDLYPEKSKWYEFKTSRYMEDKLIFINNDLVFQFNDMIENKEEIESKNENIILFLTWILAFVNSEINAIRQNTDLYNRDLPKNLPYYKRTGKIKRQIYWDILGRNAIRLNERIDQDSINALQKIVESRMDEESLKSIQEITAAQYFRFCEICYDANNYFNKTDGDLSPVGKYIRMADGRCGGLTSLEPDSEESFRQWYHSEKIMGAHPWEICSGGNSTHISLGVSNRKDDWILILAGSSILRVEETARMAIALHKHNIPFILPEGEEILRMINGTDYIGIVPDHFSPRYCHSLFPKNEQIIDFMNLESEEQDALIKNAEWYPIPPVVLR